MIPVIPKQRQHKATATKRFNSLINYLQGEQVQEQTQQQELWVEGMPLPTEPTVPSFRAGSPNEFSDILDYATAGNATSVEGEKCIGIRTHGVIGIDTASAEMNAVARMNTRCADPVYHFILSWPEHEKPSNESIFDAAEHAIKSLGFEEHQYVIAVHANTDNIHCHVAMNRVHPITHKSRHIEWAKRTLHFAARESEIKHGWTHDNGIYVVQVNGQGEKQIVLNTKHKDIEEHNAQAVHPELEREEILPAWHDPESLDSWLKTTVTKALKQDVPALQNWQGLHAWLEKLDISIKDTGGGGLRLTAISHETGEVLEVPASKAFRFLKRADLEKRWGEFEPPQSIGLWIPETAHLTDSQMDAGVNYVLDLALDNGVPPPPHVLGQGEAWPEQDEEIDEQGEIDDERRDYGSYRQRRAQRAGVSNSPSLSGVAEIADEQPFALPEEGRSLHGMPDGDLAGRGQNTAQLLPGDLQDDMGVQQTGSNPDVRRTHDRSREGGTAGRGVNAQGYVNGRRERDPKERAKRKAERAAAREDLRKRFQRYRTFVAEGDTDYTLRLKVLRQTQSAEIKAINLEAKQAKASVPKVYDRAVRLTSIVAIDAEATRRKVAVRTRFKERTDALSLTRVPPLQWREWLLEQSNRGDKAALSALRGIVYQAQRDAKLPKDDAEKKAQELEDLEQGAAQYQDLQYKRLMARLLEEERKEKAIRSNSVLQMRPHEVDSLMISYAGMQWRVTGNGNIEYSRNTGQHLFTDRGNRVTFDRERVTDEEIKLALVHSREKFGPQLTLTGEDPVFVHRMARLADDMGLKVLNPELSAVVIEHRRAKHEAAAKEPAMDAQGGPVAASTGPANGEAGATRDSALQEAQPLAENKLVPLTPIELQGEDALRAKVLAIDPRASFELADEHAQGRVYTGPVAAAIDEDPAMFAQHIGRGRYVLHKLTAPQGHEDAIVEVRYRAGSASVIQAQAKTPEKGRGR
ncbi:relaxase/mobilization nuclease domain-containing protein [Comamonas testosteroni]|jgi:hypothetical protein|uniref:relaxase/mobilization nuclease domain-containing protein n=1 Tax=Comamonas testosteroni TaxID=285 RepID=UPI0026EF689B|nr:relaxase/mobilization nuclease domain-containing protein [Comamonas testosteroni]